MNVRRIKARLLTIQFSVKFPESVPRQSFVTWVAELERCLQSQLHFIHPEQTCARHANKKRTRHLFGGAGRGERLPAIIPYRSCKPMLYLCRKLPPKTRESRGVRTPCIHPTNRSRKRKITRHHLKKAHGRSLAVPVGMKRVFPGNTLHM